MIFFPDFFNVLFLLFLKTEKKISSFCVFQKQILGEFDVNENGSCIYNAKYSQANNMLGGDIFVLLYIFAFFLTGIIIFSSYGYIWNYTKNSNRYLKRRCTRYWNIYFTNCNWNYKELFYSSFPQKKYQSYSRNCDPKRITNDRSCIDNLSLLSGLRCSKNCLLYHSIYWRFWLSWWFSTLFGLCSEFLILVALYCKFCYLCC